MEALFELFFIALIIVMAVISVVGLLFKKMMKVRHWR